MKCLKGECPSANIDPLITVVIVHNEQGSMWGHYCNIECAASDMINTATQLKDGKKIHNISELGEQNAGSTTEVPSIHI